MTPKKLQQTVRNRYNPKLTKGGFRAGIERYLDAVQSSRSHPQEDTSMIVPRAYLESPIMTMKEYIVRKFK
jgi:uncharacterized membrane protein YgcG